VFEFQLIKLRISSFDKINRIQRVLNIDNVKFELSRNKRILALLGDSGIGKTTIFRSLFSNYVKKWEKSDSFEFECNHIFNSTRITHDCILKGTRSKELNFGFATQVPYFFNNKSVHDNLFGPLKWKKIKMIDKKKEEFVKLFNLDRNGLIYTKMGELSGGQRQIVNLARMLIVSPKLAIIDECFSNMDNNMAAEYIDIMKNNFPDCFFFITSHRMSDIDHFGAEKIFLKRAFYKTGKPFVTME